MLRRVLPRTATSRCALLAVVMLAAACSSNEPTLVSTEGTTTPVAESPSPEPATPGDDPDPVVAGGDPTPTVAATASPTAAPQSDDDPQTTPTSVAATPTVSPSSTGCVTAMAASPIAEASVAADLDDDRAPDRLVAYAVQGTRRVRWRIRVETATESVEGRLDVESGLDAPVEPLGAADVDGDGAVDEVFTVVGAGASSRIVTLHTRVGCELAQVTSSDVPAMFPVGGSIGNIGGLTCVDRDGDGAIDRLVAWVGVADFDRANGDYLIDGVEYALRGTELSQVAVRPPFEANIAEADFVYGQLSCGAVNS